MTQVNRQSKPQKLLLLTSTTLITTTIIILTASLSQANFISDGEELWASVQKEIQSLTNLNFSDIINSLQTLINPNFSSTETDEVSQEMENKPYGSYDIEQDIQEKQTTDSAYQYLEETTFSKTAKQQQEELATATANNVTANQQLSQDSQNSDVSQHILQNISGQLSLIGEQNATLILQQENQQNNIAWSNLLLGQQAEEIREQNTKNRKEYAATSNIISRQIGLLRPAGLPLDDNSDTSVQSNNQSYQPLNPDEVFSLP